MSIRSTTEHDVDDAVIDVFGFGSDDVFLSSHLFSCGFELVSLFFSSPTGKKFRSKPQLSRYLGNSVDLGCFDFRTGKIMPSKMQKNKQRLRSDNLNLSKGKPDLNTALPIRQTASIFKQPVTKVVNHPNNKVKTDLQRATEQPRQLFWEKRLKGLRSSDVSEEALRTMDLPRGLQSMGPDSTDETLLSAIASALHMSSAPITGQTSSAAEKNPSIWLNTSQPLCKAFTVTDYMFPILKYGW
ncbi:methyl-CpG-binding domain protein 2-like [Sinocyclocheilus anshuiensis]|uniref:methyl-CpG-binding domain protein 2-like n=1 Tax=Sinocyclocheilus anshuiensis TaxID=1608454 RepID=UPI0007B98D19|nr:PREDICTED: methyl-CpG-binding domain protein 2-like [Sinocyclocheilus anshuiensis]